MNDKATRYRLNMGGYWMRHLLILPFLLLLSTAIDTGANYWLLGTMLCLAVLYFLWTIKKRALFDDTTLYLLRGWNEERIPFEQIGAIYPTNMIVNRVRRIWKIEYSDQKNTRRAYHFIPRYFDYSPEFLQTVKSVNPSVYIPTPSMPRLFF